MNNRLLSALKSLLPAAAMLTLGAVSAHAKTLSVARSAPNDTNVYWYCPSGSPSYAVTAHANAYDGTGNWLCSVTSQNSTQTTTCSTSAAKHRTSLTYRVGEIDSTLCDSAYQTTWTNNSQCSYTGSFAPSSSGTCASYTLTGYGYGAN